jgi:hypothetical protein
VNKLLVEVQPGDNSVQPALLALALLQGLVVAVLAEIAHPALFDVLRRALRELLLEQLEIRDDLVRCPHPGFDVQTLLLVDLGRVFMLHHQVVEVPAPVRRRLVRKPENEIDIRLLPDLGRTLFIHAHDLDIADAFHSS